MLRSLKRTVLSFAAFILIWQAAVAFGDFNPALFPKPQKVLEAFQELISTGLQGSSSGISLFAHIQASLARFFAGYVLAVVFGVVLGLLLGWFPRVFAYVNPVIQLLRPIAPVAWLPFIVLWIGIGDVPAVAIIFIAGFFPVLLSTAGAVSSVDPVFLKVAENFNLSQFRTVAGIVFLAAFPQIANSLHLALSTFWIFLVSGEMVGAQSGLGFLVMDAKNCIRADALLAAMITIGGLGVLLDFLIGRLEKWVSNTWGFGIVKYEKERGR